MKHSHEIIRHGEKASDGSLSEEGKMSAEQSGVEYLRMLQEAEPGTLFFVTPSNVGRAIETGRGVESKMVELAAEDASIEIVSVHDPDLHEKVESKPDAKFIITDVHETRQFGFTNETNYVPAWNKYKKFFNGDDGQIVNAWVTRQSELAAYRNEIAVKYPDIDVEEINPADFVRTPEEEALNYIRSSRRMHDIKEKHFPGRPYIHLQAGHNPADLALVALTGKKLTLANFREVTGDVGRDFVEPSSLDIDEEKAVVSYRGQEFIIDESLDEIIERLEKESEERRVEWSDQ